MEQYLIIARSVTYAQRMQMALDRAGIRCQIFRAPRELTTLGCAYAVQLQAGELSRALPVLHRAFLDPVQIYVSQSGFYREVET